MREVDSLFDTLVTTFYKNKVLSMIPDLVFTLESTRFSKAVIISQKLLESKHKANLRKGLDGMRRNVSRYYIKLDKTNEESKTQQLAVNLIHKIFLRKNNFHVFQAFSKMKFFAQNKIIENLKDEMGNNLESTHESKHDV